MALEFNGSSQSISLSAHLINDLLDGADGSTFMFWTTPDNLDGKMYISSYIKTGYNGWQFMLASNKWKVAGRSVDSDSFQSVYTPDVVVADVRQHVVGVHDYPNDKIIIYLNGVESIDQAVTFGSNTYVKGTSTDVDWIAADTGGSSLWADCILEDVRFYRRVLSLAEIQSIYHSMGSDNIVNGLVGRWLMNEKPDGTAASGANSIKDISGNGNHGTPQNSPVYRATPIKLIKPMAMM